MGKSSKNLLEGIEAFDENSINETNLEVKITNETIDVPVNFGPNRKIKYYRNKITGEKIHWTVPNLEKRFEVLEVVEE